MRRSLLISLVWMPLANSSVGGELAALNYKPIKLSEAEKNFLEETVCKKTRQLNAKKINAFSFSATAARPAYTSARVECEAHETYPQGLAHYVDECTLKGVDWECPPPQLELNVTLNKRAVTLRPWSMAPEKAYNLLQTISAKGQFQGISLDQAIGNSCDVGTTKDREIFELNCDSLITVSYWCPQKKETGCPRVLFLSTAKDRQQLGY